MSDEDLDPIDEGYEIVYPFVVVESIGGPYEDRAFSAGFTVGRLHGELSAWNLEAPGAAEVSLSQMVPGNLIPQLDLVAMHHGWTLTIDTADHDMADWVSVTFHAPSGAAS